MPVYLKYGKIKGTVKEPAHRGWIELQSFQWGVGRSISSPTAVSRENWQPNVTEIVVTKVMDNVSSPLLYQEALMGRGRVAVIDLVRNDGSVYLRITMSEALIAGYNVSGGGDKPMESLSLNFQKIPDVKIDPGTPPP